MATKKKMLQAAAGNAGGAGLDVEEVFSTYLYTSTGSSFSVNNGIDLAGEGGLVWTKGRDSTRGHWLYDTERGTTKGLVSSQTNGEFSVSNAITSFNSNGYTLGTYDEVNSVDNKDQVSWTFRKAPKFFDVVTYFGNSQTSQTIAHSLGSSPGMMIIKRTDGLGYWWVYHRSLGADYFMRLHATNAKEDYAGAFNDTEPTATHFTVGSDSEINYSGRSYVAYLFAHNDGDGDFGADGDADIIKCGSYTGNESSFPTIDLGFEPQFILLKSATSGEDWHLIDTMRGWLVDGNNTSGDYKHLWANGANSEGGGFGINVTSTGFELTSANAHANSNGNTFIYMAIRRGTKVPESGTEVFAVEESTAGTGTLPLDIIPTIGFAPDWGFVIRNRISGSRGSTLPYIGTRLTGYGRSLLTDRTNAEGTATIYAFDTSDAPLVGDAGGANDPGAENIHWLWKRAPGFCDVVAYSGDGVAGRTVSHNLGVAPEMMIVKSRTENKNWIVYHKDLTDNTKYIDLNRDTAESTATTAWNSTSPTETVFTVGTATSVNNSSQDFISYLFSSLDGISKVGSYTGTGSTINNIDCGFTTGARFVLIKRTDATGDWIVYDAERGITVNTTDEVLRINTANAEATENTLFGGNRMIPRSYGFAVVESDLNASGGTYIFYAIA